MSDFNSGDRSGSKNGPQNDESRVSYDDDGSECNITSNDLDQIANLVDVIKEIYADIDEENIDVVSNEIDSNIQGIMMDLGNKLTPDLAQEVASVYNLNAKFAFYNVCFTKAFEILSKLDSKVASVFSTIQDTNVKIISKFTDKLLSLHPTINDLIQRLEEVEAERLNGRNGLGDAGGDSGKLQERWNSERQQLQRQIDELREENMNCMDKIIKQSREIENFKRSGSNGAVLDSKPATSRERQQKINNQAQRRDSKTQQGLKARLTNFLRQSPDYKSRNLVSTYDAKGPRLLNWQGLHQNIGDTNKRVITLKQLKDLIEEISVSKEKYDAKCAESSLPRETMEQHMFSYLNQKFGLRNLVVEWASALINALRRYWSRDNDVAVFAMILRNECDEEFRVIQKQVKSTIKELFKTTIKTKYPRKKNAEISLLLKNKFKGSINQDEAIEILRYIYNDDDFNQIIGNIEDALEVPLDESESRRNKEEVTLKPIIKYQIFEKIILDFQLKSHHSFLSKFIAIFRVYDHLNLGYINETAFRDMIQTIDPEGNLDSSKLLGLIDPHEMDVITFSTCVSVFSSEPIGGANGALTDADNTTILQYISDER